MHRGDTMTLLEAVKKAHWITTDSHDEELLSLIEAGKLYLKVAGIDFVDESNELIRRALILYTRVYFGTPPDFDRLKAALEELVGLLSTATGYTDYGHIGHEDGDPDAGCW